MNKPSPFPTAPRKKPGGFDVVDTTMLKVEKGVPIPSHGGGPKQKYMEMFESMRPGDCITCDPKETQNVATSLRRAINKGQLARLSGCCVVIRSRCQDGHGRVWASKVAK
jgi:hypothetical protein